jgi:predicted nucleotide-binding protein
MENNNIITFILVGKKDDQLEKELIDMDSVIDYGNAIILRGTTKFRMLYDNMKDDFKFRIIVHYGLKEDANSVGKKIATALKDYNIPLEYFTRETSIFTEKNKVSTMYSPPDAENGSQIKMYNFDEMNTRDFINQLPTREKNMMKSPTAKTKIFIGSSRSGLEYANKIKEYFDNNKEFDAHVWTSEFPNNKVTLESLEKILQIFRYSIFIFTPDDTIMIEKDGSKSEKKIPRDNVIFEYGLFYGKYSRTKTFLVLPYNYETIMKTMSDIKGLNPYTYTDDEDNLLNAVTTACNSIIEEIKKQE